MNLFRNRPSLSLSGRSLATLCLLVGVVGGAGTGTLHAQDGDDGEGTAMTVEELEAFIEQQKADLEEVRSSRQITEEKIARVQEQLAEEEAKRAEALAEMEALCEAREEIEAGSYDDCIAAIEQE